MATFVTANKKAKSEFEIPVSWQVFDKVKVQANSLEEAYNYIQEHLDEIPLGDDEDYVDGSYEIAADDVDNCIGYQPINDVVCTEFNCEDDLAKYIDSMLFDSTSQGGDNIAAGTFVYNGESTVIYLDICGEVSVTYKDEVYHRPSEFPDELKALIKAHPNNWDTCGTDEDGIYISLNNWFEYIYDTDGDVLEADLSKMSKEQVLDDMLTIARQYFGISD